jgi:hypothetical protein
MRTGGSTLAQEINHVVPLGEKREIDGRLRAHYYGYWIKAYPIPTDTLSAKKHLIESLARRLFNHTEYGLNIPGTRLDEARAAYDGETDPAKRRVKGAMLAGALFNRATAILTKLVEIQALGVEIKSDNQLMRECGRCLQEALTLGKLVMHRSGEEGIDELWGEPFKAFAFPIADFFESRYIKIAQTMRDIDRISEVIVSQIGSMQAFAAAVPIILNLGERAKTKMETLAADPEVFDTWAEFKVAFEQVQTLHPELPAKTRLELIHEAERGRLLIVRGAGLISDISRVRVPMPKSLSIFIDDCHSYRAGLQYLVTNISSVA